MVLSILLRPLRSGMFKNMRWAMGAGGGEEGWRWGDRCEGGREGHVWSLYIQVDVMNTSRAGGGDYDVFGEKKLVAGPWHSSLWSSKWGP